VHSDDEVRSASADSDLPTRPWWRRPAVMLLVVIAVAAAISAVRQGETPPALVVETRARAAPAFSLPGVVDEESVIRLSDHRGVPVVLNFWASWCAPCRREMPVLAQVSAELSGRVDFVGIDHQDRREDALELLRETGVSYPTAFDQSGGTARDYELRGLPTTVFIDADGRVLATSLGELTESELRSAILELFDVAAD